jgi:hypothetical protein
MIFLFGLFLVLTLSSVSYSAPTTKQEKRSVSYLQAGGLTPAGISLIALTSGAAAFSAHRKQK